MPSPRSPIRLWQPVSTITDPPRCTKIDNAARHVKRRSPGRLPKVLSNHRPYPNNSSTELTSQCSVAAADVGSRAVCDPSEQVHNFASQEYMYLAWLQVAYCLSLACRRSTVNVSAGASYPTLVLNYLGRYSNAQEGRGNGRNILAWALVLAVEQNFKLSLQIIGSTVFFSCFECIHGRPVVFSECKDEL